MAHFADKLHVDKQKIDRVESAGNRLRSPLSPCSRHPERLHSIKIPPRRFEADIF
jgi:hypothetical protein